MGRSEITIVIVERRRVVWSASAQVEAEPGTTAVQRVISSAGSLLELRHGPRPGTAVTPREGEIEGHLEGWEYFLPKLAETV